MEIIVGVEVTALVDNGDMSFDIGIASELDNTTLYLLNNFDLIPRPQGVRFGELFILPKNIPVVEQTSQHIYDYANITLPGDLA
ncbi:hypothetical protein D3C75_937170 [compost metagenome]